MREVPDARPDIESGVLVVDQLTFERAGVVALSIAQSAAMEYYERIVERSTSSCAPNSIWWIGTRRWN